MRLLKLIFLLFFIILILLPILIHIICKPKYDFNNSRKIKFKDINTDEVQTIGLEEYVAGVVAAEMPSSFHIEALKAQAVAARTYTINKLMNEKDKRNYITNDHRIDQAHIDEEEMKKRWGLNFYKNYNKIVSAVKNTQGEMILYNDLPISAVYHSTSAGKTQNARDVWGGEVPYLKSVNSPLDKVAPKFNMDYNFSLREFMKKLSTVHKNIKKDEIRISNIKKLASGYIKSIDINGKTFKGSKIRELFGLRSNYFEIENTKDGVYITTKGYGHGVGMSQYGANFMAEEGKTYKEILQHYYKNVKIIKYN